MERSEQILVKSRPQPGETFQEWSLRETVIRADIEAFVNNRIEKRRKRTKLAKASRRKNRRK
jgi:hypothetical protein